MTKMETWEEDRDSESCRSSVISDLDELEANLYSYVHHERNSCFDQEYSTGCNISTLEVCQHSESLDGGENIGVDYNVDTRGKLKSLGGGENFTERIRNHFLNGLADSACYAHHSESDSRNSSLQSDAAFAGSSSVNNGRDVSMQSQDSSPAILEISSSDDCEIVVTNVSKYRVHATTTPVAECIVIDDSDGEVQIELEKIKSKSKKRKNHEIEADIKLNTRNNNEVICLDLDDDRLLPVKENVDSLQACNGYENTEQERTICKNWTPRMVQFYDESWGGERINIRELQKSMSDDGWTVDVSDKVYSLNSKNQSRRYFGIKSKAWCTKCNQRGHYRNECTEKISPPRCFRCGSAKHQEYSCNQKICLTCGRKRHVLVSACEQCRQRNRKNCYICRQHGHPPGCCPDLWRQFHATVVPGELVPPQNVLYKDPKNTYCCNCASKGHHVFQCKKNSFSDYTAINPRITNYVDPEVLLKSESTCDNTSTNWENVGGVAPESWNGEAGLCHKKRGIKRVKTTNSQKNSKHIKLSKYHKSANSTEEIISWKNCNKPQNLVKRKEIIKLEKLKAKQEKLQSEKRNKNYQNKSKLVINGNHTNSLKSGKAKDVNSEKSTGPKDPELQGKAIVNGTHAKNPRTGSVERVVALSPGHLKRIESEEGKEILNYIINQFKGVTARVASEPSGVLKLLGTGTNIDRAKTTLFDILTNKCDLKQLKESLNCKISNGQLKKSNKKILALGHRAKNACKVAHVEPYQNECNEARPPNETHSTVGCTGDTQNRNGKSTFRNKVQPNAVQLKNSKKIKSGKDKFQRKKNNTVGLGTIGNTKMRSSQSSAPPNNHPAKPIKATFSAVCESDFGNNMLNENYHYSSMVNNNVINPSLSGCGGSQSNTQCGVNRSKRMRRTKNRKNEQIGGNKGKLRCVQVKGMERTRPANHLKKYFHKKIIDDLDKLGVITVEVGNNVSSAKRKVCFSDEPSKYNHSKGSNNQQCSQDSLRGKHLPVQGSSSRESGPRSFLQARTF